FRNADDAKKALEQLNGFELAGRPMKVGNVTERTDLIQGPSLLDTDELDRSGIDLGATGRLQLMFKLAEGTGLEIPPAAANALNMTPAVTAPQINQQTAPPIATQCFMLSNMFDPQNENNSLWVKEIRDDVIEECNKHGGVLHVYVDQASPQGNVYVKCPSIATAVAAVNSLHGRWFAGRMQCQPFNYLSLVLQDEAYENKQELGSSRIQSAYLVFKYKLPIIVGRTQLRYTWLITKKFCLTGNLNPHPA
ncbi:hypothetical protein TSAR_000613, partial [Trichomalopsis sarcophagae]